MQAQILSQSPDAAANMRAIAAAKVLRRRRARSEFASFIEYVNPSYKTSYFSDEVCKALDKFVQDVIDGKRPVLVFQAPPQHGKSELVSRWLPAYLMGRFADWNICSASYSETLARSMAQDVKQNREKPAYRELFPVKPDKKKYGIDATLEFDNPNGTGRYLGDGIGGGFTGRPAHIFIIDDPTKNAKDALSTVVKEGHWNWYQSCCVSRMQEQSGTIIMATSWAEDDLPGRIIKAMEGTDRLTWLKFPALNEPGEPGYNHEIPEGALVPALHSREKLLETKLLFSAYWWAAIYQQAALEMGGTIFKADHIQYYGTKDLPAKFDKIIASWDMTFKDTDGTDYVVGQVWGKKGANSYLLDSIRRRMTFTDTVKEVVALKKKWPRISEILIEDKANGPAVIDTLKGKVHGIIAVEPDGSKQARASAMAFVWEAHNIWLPPESLCPWVKEFVHEIVAFPAGANDDQVDSFTQAIRRLYPVHGKLKINKKAIAKMSVRR